LFSVDCYGTAYKGPALAALHQTLLEKLNALPGVRSASLATAVPFQGAMDSTRLFLFGRDPDSANDEINVCVVSPRYFETMGMPLVAGHDFGADHGEQAPRVAIVTESMARRYFPNENPLGKRISLTKQDPNEEREIVGIVKDAKFSGVRRESAPVVFLSHRQDWTRPAINFALRATGDPASLIGAVRQTIQSAGRDIPMTSVRTFTAQASQTLARERLIATISGFFGFLALLLTCVGLFGLLSYAVSGRTNEIGVRIALGARRRDIQTMIMRETMSLILPGVIFGLAATLLAVRLIASLLFGLSPADPATLLAATCLMILVAACAGYLPARRAAKVHPMVALRCE
jgi:predicted permease